VARAHETGTMHNWEIHSALAEARLIAPTWPEADGGRGCDAFAMAELLEEVAAAEVPQDGWMTTLLVAETLRQCGTPEQREKVIGEVLRGDVLIALGYSEPEVGSDIASVQTRAERDGAGWIINGQKMFTTLAHESSYVLLLTRTDPDAAKHRGLTVFLVPLDTAGIGIAAIRTLGGERTNITYYDDVHVSDKWRVGEVNEGWRVLQVALAFERVPVAQGELFRLYRRMVGWTTATERLGGSLLEQPSVRQRMARMAIDQRMGALLAQRMTAVGARGELPIVEGSMAKLFTSEAFARHASVSMDIVGAASLLEHGQPGAALNGSIEHAFRHAQGMTIYAGTSEIQRSIIAERGLGLPRSR
jgi:alkylation response protein AidB-like acyl-CoA dehydrogenase